MVIRTKNKPKSKVIKPWLWNQEVKPTVRNIAPREPVKGQGLYSTKWKGFRIIYIYIYIYIISFILINYYVNILIYLNKVGRIDVNNLGLFYKIEILLCICKVSLI